MSKEKQRFRVFYGQGQPKGIKKGIYAVLNFPRVVKFDSQEQYESDLREQETLGNNLVKFLERMEAMADNPIATEKPIRADYGVLNELGGFVYTKDARAYMNALENFLEHYLDNEAAIKLVSDEL